MTDDYQTAFDRNIYRGNVAFEGSHREPLVLDVTHYHPKQRILSGQAFYRGTYHGVTGEITDGGYPINILAFLPPAEGTDVPRGFRLNTRLRPTREMVAATIIYHTTTRAIASISNRSAENSTTWPPISRRSFER